MTDHALTPETLAELEQAVETLPPGPFEVYENIHAEAAVAEAGRGGFGVVALPATGREDYGRAYIVAITNLLNAAPALIAAAREQKALTIEVLETGGRLMGCRMRAERAEAERDAALAEVAALRERMTALVEEWSAPRSANPGEPVMLRRWSVVLAMAAALDVDTAGHDDSSERDGGR